jgi:hypothetical protein
MFDNLFVLTRTVLFSFLNADWQGARQHGGTVGLAGEFFSSLLGANTTPFFIDDRGGWDRGQIMHLLNSHGVEMWGWGHSMGQYYFRVKRQQGVWAQHLLLRHGVPLCGPLLPGASSPSSSGPRSPVKGQPAETPFSPIGKINEWVDKLGGF